MKDGSEQLPAELVQQPGCQWPTSRALDTTLTPSPIGTLHRRHRWNGAKLTKFRRLSSCTPPEPWAQMVGYTCETHAQIMCKTLACQRESQTTIHRSLATAQFGSEQSPLLYKHGCIAPPRGAAAPRAGVQVRRRHTSAPHKRAGAAPPLAAMSAAAKTGPPGPQTRRKAGAQRRAATRANRRHRAQIGRGLRLLLGKRALQRAVRDIGC